MMRIDSTEGEPRTRPFDTSKKRRKQGWKRDKGWRFAFALVLGWTALSVLLSGSEARAKGDDDETRIERWHHATQQERHEMRDAARGYWRDLSTEDRRRIRHRLWALRRALPEFSRFELRLLVRRMIEMPRVERRALRARLMEINELDEAARAELEADLRDLIAEGADELHHMEENARRWQKMSPEEREALREQAQRFRRLPFEERRRILEEWSPRDSGGRSKSPEVTASDDPGPAEDPKAAEASPADP